MRIKMTLGLNAQGNIIASSLALRKVFQNFLCPNGENQIGIEFQNDIIKLFPQFPNDEIIEKTENGKLIYLKKNINIGKKGKISPTNKVAKAVADKGQTFYIGIENDHVAIKPLTKSGIDKDRKGKVFMVKSNKGGLGKSLITAQIAMKLAIDDYKVLIISTDDQNSTFSHIVKRVNGTKPLPPERENTIGVYTSVVTNKMIGMNLRENIDFIPYEDVLSFDEKFEKAVPKFLEKHRKIYDFILIDTGPSLARAIRSDYGFAKYVDKFIVPIQCSEDASLGAIKVAQAFGSEKIFAIINNMFVPDSDFKDALSFLNKMFKDKNDGTIYTKPIPLSKHIRACFIEGISWWEAESIFSVRNYKEFKKIIPTLEFVIEYMEDYKNELYFPELSKGGIVDINTYDEDDDEWE